MWFSQHDAVTVSKYLKEIKSFITLRPGIHDVRAYRQHIRRHCMYFLLMHAALWISSPPLYSCVLSLSSGHSSAGKRETNVTVSLSRMENGGLISSPRALYFMDSIQK